jgi:hypothetical protein
MVDISIEDWLWIYSTNKKDPAQRGDIYNVTNALNGEIRVLSDEIGVITEELINVEDTLLDVPTIEQRVTNLEDLINRMLVDYAEQGIEPRDPVLIQQLEIALTTI